MTTSRPIVVGLGEILWDVFPDGPRFGGAPANYACHAAGLGADSHMFGAVGDDELGGKALEALAERDVETTCVARLPHPTGTVQVTLDERGSASYEFAADAAWDNLQFTESAARLARRADAVCFGTLGQRSIPSRRAIQSFVEAVPQSSLRIFDVNLRPPFYETATIIQSLELANVLKLNDEELPAVARSCGANGSPLSLLRKLADRFDLRAVALTRGAAGALLVRDDQSSDLPAPEVAVVDTVGAGDAFTACLTLGLLAGLDLEAVNHTACRVAAWVCSQSGAAPPLPAEFAKALTGVKDRGRDRRCRRPPAQIRT